MVTAGRLLTRLGLLLAVLLAALSVPRPAQTAGVFVVNSAGDASDSWAEDGICDICQLPGDPDADPPIPPTPPCHICTLRAAIEQANWNGGATILFSVGAVGAGSLPCASAPVTIQGPVVLFTGLCLSGNSTVRGLEVAGGAGVSVSGPYGTIEDNTISGWVSVFGSSSTIEGNTISGWVSVSGSSSTIEGNTVSSYVYVSGSSSTLADNTVSGGVSMDGDGNSVKGNHVGTDATAGGVSIRGSQNTVGGSTPEERNIISGWVSMDGDGNVVKGNYIGTDATGTAALGCGGVSVTGLQNTVGGSTAEERNIICGGAYMNGDGNGLKGNYIGTDVTGTVALGGGGVSVTGAQNTVGGSTAEDRNIICGGAYINGDGNGLKGNYIGTDATGTTALDCGSAGVSIGGSGNTVGGGTTGERNLVCGEVSTDGDGNSVKGNYIGTDATGTVALGCGSTGVSIGGSGSTLGGSTPGERNIISGSGGNGVSVSGDGNAVKGNYIGTDVTGTVALANGYGGVYIHGSQNTIGGSTAEERNIISGNGGCGVEIRGDGNAVKGNYIGTDVTGTMALPNGSNGVSIYSGGSQNTVEGNIISGNVWRGVDIQEHGNWVKGNYIGTDVTGTVSLPNGEGGVTVSGTQNVIGGSTPEERNIISGNGANGAPSGGTPISVWIDGDDNALKGNYIGTDVNGTVALPNGGQGVLILGSRNTVERNVISGHPMEGVYMHGRFGFDTGNRVQGNHIGTDVTGTVDLGNGGHGLAISANATTVGGVGAGEANVIAFNGGDGVRIDGGGSGFWGLNNSVRGNSIFSNGGKGIENSYGGNNELPPPIVTAVGGVHGTACADCWVDIYSDSEDEGRIYEGSAQAGASGEFTWLGTPEGPHVTATATDAGGNTSEFSQVPAVLLVHGWHGSCVTFANLEPWLENALPVSADRVECFDPPNDGRSGYRDSDGTKVNAQRLANYVDDFLNRMAPVRDGKIDIVAHSYGGLVARYYIEKLGGASKVRSLTMLGTPNKGTPAANWWVALHARIFADRATWDMRTASNKSGGLLYSLNHAFHKPSGVDYQAIAGTWPTILWKWIGDPNDCLVPEDSVKGPFPDLTKTRTASHPAACSGNHAWLTRDPPSPDCTSDPGHVFCDVLQVLDPSRAFGTSRVQALPATELGQAQAEDGAAEVNPHTSLALGTIQQGEVKTHPIPIDASSATATFMLFWEGDGASPMLHLTLEKPDGTTVDASGPGVVYEPAGLFMDGLMVEAYYVEAPETGTWIARVEGTTVPAEGHSYAVTAFLDSPVSLSASATPTSVVQGEAITLTAEPQDTGVPVAGATATVAVTKPDSSVQNLTLRDDGSGCDSQADDGSYCEMFTDTATAGIYSFQFQVSGTVASGPFDRQELVLVDAHVAGDAAGDPTNADDDGDGFHDDEELYVSTDPLDACPDNTGDDAWPLDMNMDKMLTVAGDVWNFRDRIGARPGDPNWRQRLNLNGDGQITVAGDVFLFRGMIGKRCI